jgi:SAM-dependent methyltransferase
MKLKKRIKLIYEQKIVTPRILNNYLKSNETTKLNIAAGESVLDGWFNTDIRADSPQIFYMDATKTLPLNNRCIDYIYCEHFIEHITYKQGIKFLQECHRVLKCSGKIRIATPNLDFIVSLNSKHLNDIQKDYIKWYCDRYVTDRLPRQDYDAGLVINSMLTDHEHKFVYRYSILKESLQHCGFENVKRYSVGESEDVNLQGLECHGKILENEIMNKFETFVVEGTNADRE